MTTETAVRVRVATFADAEAISLVAKRNGIGGLDREAWRSQWEAYPFAADFQGIPTGWVLETGSGAVVGTLDNIHMLYQFRGKRLKGVVAAGWAVDPEHRGKALQLMTTFFRQKGVDLYLNVSATPATAQLLTALRIGRLPIPGYDNPYFWAARPRAFARAVLLRKSIPGATILAWPAGWALAVRDIARRSGRGRLTSEVRRLAQFDQRFDEFWSRICDSGRLRAIRTRAALEWRFRGELRSQRIAVVAAERAGRLVGYAVLTRREGTEMGMDLYEVADLQAEGEDPSIVRDLLIGSIRIAREAGADAVKFAADTPVKQAAAEALCPYSYRVPFWQQYFKADPALVSQLSTADAWDFSRFDTF